MGSNPFSTIQRRDFLKLAGAAALVSVTDNAIAAPERRIAIVIDSEDAASSAPVKWAIEKLRQALAAKGMTTEVISRLNLAKGAAYYVLVADPTSRMAKAFPL